MASHLVTSGVDIRTVHELLGHQSLAMTKRYSHLAPVHRMRAVQILDTVYVKLTQSKIRLLGNRKYSVNPSLR